MQSKYDETNATNIYITVDLCVLNLKVYRQLKGSDVISAQISLEKTRQAEWERLFLVYAKQWWKEYLQIRPQHKQRLVKIFAQVTLFIMFHNDFPARS